MRSVTGGLAILVLAGCSGKPVSTAPEPVRSPEAVSAADEAIEAKQNSDLLEEGVVASARVALGKPYLYGGTGQWPGFRLLRLIQYARAAGDHAAARSAVAGHCRTRGESHSMASRGDILTFASQPGGSKVSHVGLHLGEGRFIHSSSSRGVRESTLSGTDANGQWWFVRWVGARRVIGSGTDS